MENQKEPFEYTYSAPEQAEIRRIREKYAPKTKEESTLAKLRELDASSARAATAAAILVGSAGTCLLGLGLSCCLYDDWVRFFILGVILGVIGLVLVSLAYPLYGYLVRKKRQKLAPEILRLSDELMK